MNYAQVQPQQQLPLNQPIMQDQSLGPDLQKSLSSPTELHSYDESSWIKKISNSIGNLMDTGKAGYQPSPEASHLAQGIPEIMASMTPAHTPLLGKEAYNDFQQGNYVGGALNAVGALPLPLANKATEALGRMVPKSVSVPPPSTEELRLLGNAAYKAVDEAGLTIKPDVLRDIHEASSGAVDEISRVPGHLPNARGTLDTIKEMELSSRPQRDEATGQFIAGKPISLTDLDNLRQTARTGGQNLSNRKEGEAARRIIDEIDNRISSLSQDDTIGAVNSEDALNKLSEARGYWSKFRKSELIDEKIVKAEDRSASTHSGGNINNATRQNLRQILDNKKTRNQFSKEEQGAIRSAVRGTVPQNILRGVGKFAHSIGGATLGSTVGSVAGSLLDGTVGAGIGAIGVPAISYAAKHLADAGTARQVEKISELLRGGKTTIVPRKGSTAPSHIAKIAALLSRSSGGINLRGLQGAIPAAANNEQ